MVKNKKSALSSRPISFRFKSEVHEVLNELVGTDIKCACCGKQIMKFSSKTDVIVDGLAGLVAFLLRGRISEKQIRENRRSPRQIFRLYVMVCKAEQGEKGYHFSEQKKEKRFVYGPEQDVKSVYRHMLEEPKEKTK